jgi:cysteinyl-tRNA synthetase
MAAGTAILADVSSLEDYREAFEEAMNDDFNTPEALATLFDFVKEVNRYLEEKDDPSTGTLTAMDRLFKDLAGEVLGILPDQLATAGGDEALVEGLMDIILDLRQEYREGQDWEKSDAIREKLSELGVVVKDKAEGSTWQLEP